jgi:L-cysteine:1D-myo-inositol 2-amino-2-deoxy-alpha-D-glucopyranoside ligase
MYVCGITPYDATHLGHAATYLAFDLVHRSGWIPGTGALRAEHHRCRRSLFERAQRDGVDWRELADRETGSVPRDMAALRVLPPHDYVAATEAIGEVVELVEKMLASGAAYVVDDPDYPTCTSGRRHAAVRLRVRLRPRHHAAPVHRSVAATPTAPARATSWTR